jgi:hypothetical protein
MARIPIPLEDEGQRDRIISQIKGLDLSTPWQVTVEPKSKKRSTRQNNLYSGWCGTIAKATGHQVWEIRALMRKMFIAPRYMEVDGVTHEIYPSTADLTTAEMSEHMDQVYQWASGFGLFLPVPEDRGRD